MPLVPVEQPASLSEIAYTQIRTSLLRGELAEQKSISVVALSAQLQMSRSPVATAVVRLVNEGLLVQNPNGSAAVRTLDKDELLDALQVRATLEGLAAELACPLLDDGTIDELDEIHSEFSRAVKAHDARTARIADLTFHQSIQRASGSAVLDEHLSRLQAQVLLTTYTESWAVSGPPALVEHAAVLEALRNGRAADSARLATEHVLAARSRVSRTWNK
ncbi:GntR family transcriptional regulator [Gordonia jinghuaiqii]|uniref:GntR family transcriptional regulator n=1 Tax=Gordonia jinghuaiqii TaxID=2758710 RepID=A0A7D7QQJ8_9ACTN|nr:GntR family transcriptional regulator [Gordonia jinghuaiqii]QMT02206.1 GntR family transcriptional regulator [Gordonia jinghuaiqii]